MRRLLLVGNYGVGNVGDEALKEYFLTRFPEVEWTVVSANPEHHEVPRFPTGIRSLFGTNWTQFVRVLRACDGVVFGGGSLFTDVESPHACVIWGNHVRIARLLRKPVFLAFQGVGPFVTRKGRKYAKRAVRSASFLSVRDPESHKRTTQLLSKSNNKKVIQSFDPVINLFEAKKSKERTQELLTIIPRKNSPETFIDRAAGLVMDGDFVSVRIVSMQPDDEHEKAVCKKLKERVGGEIVKAYTLDELKDALEGSARVLTERYHGALAAFGLGIPVYIQWQKEGDKLHVLSQFLANGSLETKLEHAHGLVARGEQALRQAIADIKK